MERLYHYLWKYRMFGSRLRLPDGRHIEVIDPGIPNNGAGPDFFNSKIHIVGAEEWAGNVEIHIKASDWFRHGHDKDMAYDSIILHVVASADCKVTRRDGSVIPQVEVVMPPDLYSAYSRLHTELDAVRCEQHLCTLSPLTITDWLESLVIERVQTRASNVMRIFALTGNDWQQTCFVLLARAMGFGLNGDPFELTALSLPLRFMARHSDNPIQLEALLFGQAGMLDTSKHILDERYQLLCREYYFLARKYGLKPIRSDMWKYARTRPQNMPHRRLAMLARACEGGFAMLRTLLDCKGNPDLLVPLFGWTLEGYWSTHHSFDTEESAASVRLSMASIRLLMINAVAPLYYAYGMYIGNPDMAESAIDLLEALPPEQNTIIRRWQAAGITVKSAATSQALLQLRREYCDRRDCMRCRFSHQLLRSIITKSDKAPIYS
ncbi:MAG: DUF2851 family protein [Muribaculaceae bacterium]|nr:DUF2851 family protein [Muribaculaceae bacterium]